jgi:hypothetical protein
LRWSPRILRCRAGSINTSLSRDLRFTTEGQFAPHFLDQRICRFVIDARSLPDGVVDRVPKGVGHLLFAAFPHRAQEARVESKLASER